MNIYKMLIFFHLITGVGFGCSTVIRQEGDFICEAIELLVPERADIPAKYIYAKLREWGADCKIGEQIYYHHLKVWNQFYEKCPPKNSFEDFFNCYQELLDAIKTKGFDPRFPVPVNGKGLIANGGHRVTACILYQTPVHCLGNLSYKSLKFDLAFFKNQGLEEKYLDEIALQYCRLKDNTYLVLLFPLAVGKDHLVEKTLNSYGTIIYKKCIFLSKEGAVNLISEANEKEAFVRNKENVRKKAEACFPLKLINTNPMRVYLLEAESQDQMVACESAIHQLYNMSNRSVHMTNAHQETVFLAKMLFNKNSIHFLNHHRENSFSHFTQFLHKYRRWVESLKNEEWMIVDGSAVLSAYGLRDCDNFNYIHFKPFDEDSGMIGITSHNRDLKFHVLAKDDLLFDPDNFFYYKGLKFSTLHVIKEMKLIRNAPKDARDVVLIDTITK
ncbi:MAG: hypothetical protein JJU12_02655 [Chlamydiales bacterium]|nr:hypothetical protein [Chlamydiales bacterium]